MSEERRSWQRSAKQTEVSLFILRQESPPKKPYLKTSNRTVTQTRTHQVTVTIPPDCGLFQSSFYVCYIVFPGARQHAYLFSVLIKHYSLQTHHLAMTCVRDIIATSGLAFRVHATYKDTPHYKHISEDVASLQVLIDKAAQHFKSDTITSDDRHYGQKVLKGCQGVLGELNSFIDKYKRLASMNKMLVLNRMKLGKEDITTLQVRLVSNTGLLNGFVRRCVLSVSLILWILIYLSSCEYKEVQAQLATLLGLHRINSGISVTSIASFAANTNTETAYKNLCKELCQIGVTEDMIRQKEDKILEILRSQDMVTSSQIGDRDIGDRDIGNEDQVLEMAYTEYCKDLYRIGFTDDMILQQKDKILGILRSRGVVSSQTCGSSNIGDKDIGDKGQLLQANHPLLTYIWPLTYKQVILVQRSCLHLG